LFYEEIDAVLGCRDIVTLRQVAEAGDTKNSENFAKNGTEEIETSPANRAERKRKRKREEEEEKEEEERKLTRETGDEGLYESIHQVPGTTVQHYELTGWGIDQLFNSKQKLKLINKGLKL